MNNKLEIDITFKYILDVIDCRLKTLLTDTGVLKHEGSYRIVNMLNSWMYNFKEKNLITDYTILFDETIWQPDDPDSHTNRVVIIMEDRFLKKQTSFLLSDYEKNPEINLSDWVEEYKV